VWAVMIELAAALVDAYRRLDASVASNAIETFDCRLRTEGFADVQPGSLTSMDPNVSNIHRSVGPRRSCGLAVFASLTVIATASCSRSTAAVPNSTQALPVAVAKIARRNLSRKIIVASEFRPFQEINVHAKVAGYVRAINVDVGDRVQKGQLLA